MHLQCSQLPVARCTSLFCSLLSSTAAGPSGSFFSHLHSFTLSLSLSLSLSHYSLTVQHSVSPAPLLLYSSTHLLIYSSTHLLRH